MYAYPDHAVIVFTGTRRIDDEKPAHPGEAQMSTSWFGARCQFVPGSEPTLLPEITVKPLINQTAGVPSVFCHSISALPSPLKSAAATTDRKSTRLNSSH